MTDWTEINGEPFFLVEKLTNVGTYSRYLGGSGQGLAVNISSLRENLTTEKIPSLNSRLQKENLSEGQHTVTYSGIGASFTDAEKSTVGGFVVDVTVSVSVTGGKLSVTGGTWSQSAVQPTDTYDFQPLWAPHRSVLGNLATTFQHVVGSVVPGQSSPYEIAIIGERDLGVPVSSPKCFLPGTPISLWDGGTKPIEAVAAGDVVVAYDRAGRLVPGRVARAFVNEARQVLDMHGLMVTPGHVTLCGDGPFAGRHVPILDILRSDGALVMEDGSLVRAATGCAVGSEGDRWVVAIAGERQADGTVEVAEAGRLRAGTRAITAAGEDVSVLDLIRAAGAALGEDGLIRMDGDEDGPGRPFRWTLAPALPSPEDYVLARSATTLGDVYAAAEWEGVAPRLAAPAQNAAGLEAEAQAGVRMAPVNTPLALREDRRAALR